MLLGVKSDGSAPVLITLAPDADERKDIGATFFTLDGVPGGALLTSVIYNQLPYVLAYDTTTGALTLYAIDLGAKQASSCGTTAWGTSWTAFTDTDVGDYFIAYNGATGAFRAGWLQGSGQSISITTADGTAPDNPLNYTDMTLVRNNIGPTFLLYARGSTATPKVYTIQFGPPLTLNPKTFVGAPVDILVATSFVLQSVNEYYLFTQATRTAALGVPMLTLSAYRSPKPGYPLP
jgi:hypothetical protein